MKLRQVVHRDFAVRIHLHVNPQVRPCQRAARDRPAASSHCNTSAPRAPTACITCDHAPRSESSDAPRGPRSTTPAPASHTSSPLAPTRPTAHRLTCDTIPSTCQAGIDVFHRIFRNRIRSPITRSTQFSIATNSGKSGGACVQLRHPRQRLGPDLVRKSASAPPARLSQSPLASPPPSAPR